MPEPPETYDRDYFLSDRCEGYEYFREGDLSLIRRYELQLLQLRPGLDLLDAGCGRGEMLLKCAEQGVRVAGADYSEAAVDLTRQTLAGVPDADVRRADLTHLPWADDSFDRILCGDVVEHLDPEQTDPMLSEFRRVLRPGGMFLVHTSPNRLFRKVWPYLRPLLRVAGARDAASALDDYLEDLRKYHHNEQSLRSLRSHVRRAGFDDVRVWIDPDVIRSGSHRLTRGMESSRLFSLAARVAATRPLITFIGNDLYATGRKGGAR